MRGLLVGGFMKGALGLGLVAAAVLASWVDRSGAGGQTTCVSRAAAPVPPAYAATFPDKGYPITTRQFAGHPAGIRHYRDDEFLLNRHFNTVLDGLTIFQGDSLLFPPGTKFFYSTYGWNLISAVVQGAAGQDFLSYMGRNVFRPLGMTHTAADRADSLIPNRTRFYERG